MIIIIIIRKHNCNLARRFDSKSSSVYFINKDSQVLYIVNKIRIIIKST